jgi:hypothetical protein
MRTTQAQARQRFRWLGRLCPACPLPLRASMKF